MDIQRRQPKTRRWIRFGATSLLITGGILATAFGLSRLEPALPVVQRQQLVSGTVQRGTMVREVSGFGSLVPVDIHWVTAEVGGQITEVLVEPGIEVQPDSVLVRLRDPQIERAVEEAERAIKQVEADLDRLKLRFKKEDLDLQWSTAEANAAYEDAKERADMEQELASKGFISPKQSERTDNRARRKLALLKIQMQRIENRRQANQIEERQLREDVDRARRILDDRRRDSLALTIAAGTNGILQQLGPSLMDPLEVGERIGDGGIVAKITDPHNLKAVLRISETQAREVVTGQRVEIDMRSAMIPGRVIRVDPAVQEGTVAVDVELEGELPRGARPDLSVHGTIEIERLENALFVERPAFANEDSVISLFRLEPDKTTAVRTAVRFGRSSVSTIEVLDGLQQGDEIILLDLRKFAEVDRISIH